MESTKTPHLTDEERAEVKEALLGLIGECAIGWEPLTERTHAAADAARALIKLDAVGA